MSGYVLAPSEDPGHAPLALRTSNLSDEDLLEQLEHTDGVPRRDTAESKPLSSPSTRRVRFHDEAGHSVVIPEEYLEDGEIHFASADQKKRTWLRNAFINGLFILGWFFFGTCLSVYNKWMFAPENFGFPFPLFVTSLHMVVQFGLAALFRALWPKTFKPTQSPSLENYGKKTVPTAIATSLDIGLSNVSLKTITLSFYTMCKSSSLVFVLLFAFAFRLEKFNLRLVGVILLIFSGVVLMVATETKFVLSGMILVITASAFGGLRWSLTQILLKKKDMGMDNPCATVYWLAPAMAVTLALISSVVEGPREIFGSRFFGTTPESLKTMVFLAAPGSLAFFMVMSEYYIVQRTGVVPMSIAGIFKEATTLTVSGLVFGDRLTILNVVGVLITFCGIVLFTYNKYRKSMESLVPLDAHGNPIEVEEEDDPVVLEGDEEALVTSDGLHPQRSPNVLFSARTDDGDFTYPPTPLRDPRPAG